VSGALDRIGAASLIPVTVRRAQQSWDPTWLMLDLHQLHQPIDMRTSHGVVVESALAFLVWSALTPKSVQSSMHWIENDLADERRRPRWGVPPRAWIAIGRELLFKRATPKTH
jgi:hypothetical protein